MYIDEYGNVILEHNNDKYDVHSIIKEVFEAAELPIYKEEIKLAKGIIHLRKILPITHQKTSIVKILLGKSKVYTKDEFYGYGNTNIFWYKTKIGPKNVIDTLAEFLLDPLYEGDTLEIFNDERDEYFNVHQTCDNIKLILIEKQLDKLLLQYENNPELVSEAFNPNVINISYTDIFKIKKYMKVFTENLCNFISKNYQYDNPTNIIEITPGYTKNLICKTDTNKYIILKHASTKKNFDNITFIFHTSLFTYQSNNKFFHYKMKIEIFENKPMTVTFELVKDKLAKFILEHPFVQVKNEIDPNINFIGCNFVSYKRDESINIAIFYSDYTCEFDGFYIKDIKLPIYSNDNLTNIENFKQFAYFIAN